MSEPKKKRIDKLYDRIESSGFDSLTEGERFFFALTWLYRETNNGGLHQFFFNDAGQFAIPALRGLEAVGAVRTADILSRAIDVFPEKHVPTDQAERREVLLGLPDQLQWEVLDSLTTEFFESTEPVADLLDTYIDRHQELFPTFRQ